ncbi:hypothetical protein [Parachryseolinea silvisoli]|uniref:hypothetical protein n=1 Tax=Parachryseolinea silvisoli TaxID=2873601 RepID=UPI002265BAE7|nr:hypothetical protein [Parachryseolinea silvisoli]MCD9015705.1 hypothetical protein [Parachryseolinea silvisoli]
MIFKDKLVIVEKALNPEIHRLFTEALKTQSHESDLFLLHLNGSFNKDTAQWNAREIRKRDAHVIGPGHEGHSEQAHYSFIDKYRRMNIAKMSLPEYLKLHEYSPERNAEIDELVDIEETTIQLEMLIYLKFWEADLIIKKLYQFVRLLNGEHYDWYFRVQESSRDADATGSRQDIIRLKIRDRLKKISPTIYQMIKDTYKTQLRNSIAHSNYSFLSRYIHPNNFVKEDLAAQLKAVSFDEWIDIFHNTISLHNQYINLDNMIHEHYREIARKNNNEVPVRVTDSKGNQYLLTVIYREEWDDWRYKQTDEK